MSSVYLNMKFNNGHNSYQRELITRGTNIKYITQSCIFLRKQHFFTNNAGTRE